MYTKSFFLLLTATIVAASPSRAGSTVNAESDSEPNSASAALADSAWESTGDPATLAGQDLAEAQKWLAGWTIFSHQHAANLAAQSGHMGLLEWLVAEQGVYPDQDGANMATEQGHLKVLKWLAERGVFPKHSGPNRAAVGGHLDVLMWLAAEQGVYPGQYGVNMAAGKGHLGVLKWVAEKQGLYPDQHGANLAAESGQVEVLEWLEAEKRRPKVAGYLKTQ